MTPLRRTQRDSWTVPVAAEVLELRALLSAGGAVAHAVQHQHHVVAPALTVEPSAFRGNVLAHINIAGGVDLPNVPGTFSAPTVKLVLGSKVTTSFSFSRSNAGSTQTIKGTFQGTITNIQTGALDSKITLHPTGGSLVFTDKQPGHKTITAKAIPLIAADITVRQMNTGSFEYFQATDVFLPTAPAPYANHPVSLTIELPV